MINLGTSLCYIFKREFNKLEGRIFTQTTKVKSRHTGCAIGAEIRERIWDGFMDDSAHSIMDPRDD